MDAERPVRRPHIWLVDLENTGDRWTQFSQDFASGDTVVIFYSKKAHKISLLPLQPAPDLRFQFIQCQNGTPNALDFQLVLWLGCALAKNPDAQFVIISNDNGYKSLIPFASWLGGNLKQKNVADPVTEAVTPLPEPAAAKPPELIDPAKDAYQKRLKAAGVNDDGILRVLTGILMTAMALPANQRKLSAYNLVVKRYGHADGNALYIGIKDLIHDIAKNGPYPKAPVSSCEKIWLQNGELSQSLNKALPTTGIALTAKMVPSAAKLVMAAREADDPKTYLKNNIAFVFPKTKAKKALAVLLEYI